jgi:integrase
VTTLAGAEDLTRRRFQQKGDLYQQGGWWKLRWKEDQRDADGVVSYAWSKPVWIGQAEGPGRFTEKQARRIAWDNYLSRLDQNMRTPQSIMTVKEFVERRFVPEHVTMLKKAGRVHYGAMLAHVLDGIPEKRRSTKGHKKGQELPEIKRRFGLGGERIRDVTYEQVQRLVAEAIRCGYSVQTAKHIKTCVSAIFTHAERHGWFSRRNPAYFVTLPEMARRTPTALSAEQLRGLLLALKPMARAMVLCASLTSMNIAEVCGLKWERVNLNAEPMIVDGELIPGLHLAVREQWYRGEFGTVKAAARRRNLPLPPSLLAALGALARTAPAVFSGRNARPVDAGAMLNKQIRKGAATIGFPKLGWHDLRRTFATLADKHGMSMGERQALMGHSRAAMTMQYTHTHSQQAVDALGRLDEDINGMVKAAGAVAAQVMSLASRGAI